jgi:ABC-type bacteriocin/lantibiotic exporter with double-glycine peptidase domain
MEIDGGLPAAYGAVFAILMALQWTLRRRVAGIYLENQRQNNRVIAHGYTAWDNVFTGNRYNLHLWLRGFKGKLRDCLRAQITAIMAREGLSAFGGILGLAIVFSTMVIVAGHNAGDTELLIALAATLPRQIEMTNNVHEFASGWNDVLAMWTRVGGIVDNMQPAEDPDFDRRIHFDRLLLRERGSAGAKLCGSVPEAIALVRAQPTGRITVRGGNGTGKSTLLKLLTALYLPQSGSLRLDGQMINNENREEYLSLFAAIFSDFHLFRRLYGIRAVSPQQVEDLLELLDLTGKTHLVDGELDTLDLSGGQRKRLALLVSFLEDRPIFVFDEWAADQDPLFRRKFYEELLPMLKERGKTIIAVTHDDRYFEVADRLLVMREGRLEESTR